MKTYGIPEKLTRIIKVFYTGFQCSVIDEAETLAWFDLNPGVKQGCNISGFLFLIAKGWIMKRSTKNGEKGIRWNFTTNWIT